MRKISLSFVCALALPLGANAQSVLWADTSDPLYLQSEEEILSRTTLSFGDDILRLGQSLTYGINNRLSVGGSVHFQQDFDGPEDGFSAIDLGGVYRLMRASDNMNGVITDALVGFKFGGNRRVRTPDFADSTYYAGLRVGRQWSGLTLAATIKSSWIFDDNRGMSYIDMIPEAYFRLNSDWRLGASFTLRKATNPHYNQEWLGGKVVRQYGRTQYIGHMDYEFEHQKFQIGLGLNILF